MHYEIPAYTAVLTIQPCLGSWLGTSAVLTTDAETLFFVHWNSNALVLLPPSINICKKSVGTTQAAVGNASFNAMHHHMISIHLSCHHNRRKSLGGGGSRKGKCKCDVTAPNQPTLFLISWLIDCDSSDAMWIKKGFQEGKVACGKLRAVFAECKRRMHGTSHAPLVSTIHYENKSTLVSQGSTVVSKVRY